MLSTSMVFTTVEARSSSATQLTSLRGCDHCRAAPTALIAMEALARQETPAGARQSSWLAVRAASRWYGPFRRGSVSQHRADACGCQTSGVGGLGRREVVPHEGGSHRALPSADERPAKGRSTRRGSSFRSFCAARSMWWTMSPSMASTRP